MGPKKHEWEKKGRRDGNAKEIEHFGYLLSLSESGAVLEFQHFIPRSLNGVPQSLALWDFMWDRGTTIQFLKLSSLQFFLPI